LFSNQTVSLGIEKNGGRLFRRPKLTLSCSAEGKEGKLWYNKKFWEEVITYFPYIRHKQQRKKYMGDTHRQHGDLISLLFFVFKTRKVGQKGNEV
jgi:hypothetical protein